MRYTMKSLRILFLIEKDMEPTNLLISYTKKRKIREKDIYYETLMQYTTVPNHMHGMNKQEMNALELEGKTRFILKITL